MATLYALNLIADLSADSTGFFNGYTGSNGSRCWLSTPLPLANPPVWSPCNGGANNSDTWGPTLVFSRGTPANRDQVQFGVFFQNVPTGMSITSFSILVAFGRLGRTNAANATASPFTNGNNARCLLGNEGVNPATGAYFIGPYTVNVNTSAVPNNGNLNFEFSVICSIVLTNTLNETTTYQFGYDPEMDLSIET